MRMARLLAAVALAAVAVVAGPVQPASAAPVVVDTAPVYSYHTWYNGPGKAMAVLNASTGNTAPMVQFYYSPQAPYNDVMIVEREGTTNLYRIKPSNTYSSDGNVHNDKCLAIKNNEPGNAQPIVNANCSYDSVNNDVWIREAARYYDSSGQLFYINGASQFRSQAHNKCIVVQGGALTDGAALVTHTCNGSFNSFWIW